VVRVRERVKEIADFARSESPYRSATKGWIGNDVFIEWGAPAKQTLKAGDEVAGISVFWQPINQMLALLFFLFFIATILVFLAVSFAHGNLNVPSGLKQSIQSNNSVQISITSQIADTNPLTIVEEGKTDEVAAEIPPTSLEQQQITTLESDRIISTPVNDKNPTRPDLNQTISVAPIKTAMNGSKKVKPVTAVDLFQAQRR